MFPPRCYTCNKYISHFWDDWCKGKNEQENYGVLLNKLGCNRICCRRMFLTYVGVVEDIAMYGNTDRIMDDSGTEFCCEVKGSRTVVCD
jgi:DNA-directed RNA polymerase subunit N (RpoN/RPB10)